MNWERWNRTATTADGSPFYLEPTTHVFYKRWYPRGIFIPVVHTPLARQRESQDESDERKRKNEAEKRRERDRERWRKERGERQHHTQRPPEDNDTLHTLERRAGRGGGGGGSGNFFEESQHRTSYLNSRMLKEKLPCASLLCEIYMMEKGPAVFGVLSRRSFHLRYYHGYYAQYPAGSWK